MVRFIFLMSIFLFSSLAYSESDGVYYYNLNGKIDPVPFLKKEAKKGDSISQRLLAYSEMRMGSMTSESLKWFLASARQGDLYSMIALGRVSSCKMANECSPDNGEWLAYFRKVAKEQAENDSKAMRALSYYYGVIGEEDKENEWMEKAAKAGNPRAQMELASSIASGNGFYWTSNSRKSDVEGWYIEASSSGFYPAKYAYAMFLFDEGEYEKGADIVVKTAQDGYYPSIKLLIGCGLGDVYKNRKKYCGNIVKDVSRSWGYILYLNDFGLYTNFKDDVYDDIPYKDKVDGEVFYGKLKSKEVKIFGQRVVY